LSLWAVHGAVDNYTKSSQEAADVAANVMWIFGE